jgi:hypothetical protein
LKSTVDSKTIYWDSSTSTSTGFHETERPGVELIIAMSLRPSPSVLFHYFGTACHRVSQKAIGSGILLADGLLSDLSFGVTALEQSASLALYIISKVKNRVDGCGGFTDLIALQKMEILRSPKTKR